MNANQACLPVAPVARVPGRVVGGADAALLDRVQSIQTRSRQTHDTPHCRLACSQPCKSPDAELVKACALEAAAV